MRIATSMSHAQRRFFLQAISSSKIFRAYCEQFGGGSFTRTTLQRCSINSFSITLPCLRTYWCPVQASMSPISSRRFDRSFFDQTFISASIRGTPSLTSRHAVPAVWKVFNVSCITRCPIDWLAMIPKACPGWRSWCLKCSMSNSSTLSPLRRVLSYCTMQSSSDFPSLRLA